MAGIREVERRAWEGRKVSMSLRALGKTFLNVVPWALSLCCADMALSWSRVEVRAEPTADGRSRRLRSGRREGEKRREREGEDEGFGLRSVRKHFTKNRQPW